MNSPVFRGIIFQMQANWFFIRRALSALVLFFVFYSSGLYSQNLVVNPGFENSSTGPTGYGQWYLCSNWSNLNNYMGFSWPYASPDYLKVGAGGGVGLPNSTFATVNPYAGNAIMGFIAYYEPSTDFREYLSNQLSAPLVSGIQYTISFYMTNGSAGWYSGAGCNHIGIRFSIGPLSQLTHEPLNIIPHCEISTTWWSNTWQLVSFSFVANAAYTHITLGNFYNDANTLHSMFATGANGAYYFIDEMVVAPSTILPVEWLYFIGHTMKSSNYLEWGTASESNCNYFSVERGMDGVDFTGLGSVRASGNSLNKNKYFFADENPEEGINYYRIKQYDFNGEFGYSKIIAVNYSSKEKIEIYPNPCDGSLLFISGIKDQSPFIMEIYDQQKALLCSIPVLSRQVDLPNLMPGLYICRLVWKEQVIVKKLAVR